MDKIDIHLFLNDMSIKEKIIYLLDVVNKLVEGYNKIMKRLDEHVKLHNKIDKQDNKDYVVVSEDDK